MGDGRVSVRRGDAMRDGRCQACRAVNAPTDVWVILLGDPQGHRVEVRLCDGHLADVMDGAEEPGWEDVTRARAVWDDWEGHFRVDAEVDGELRLGVGRVELVVDASPSDVSLAVLGVLAERGLRPVNEAGFSIRRA